MNRFERAKYERILSVGCTVAGMLAVVSLLWFIRTHHFNATNAGWGDQEQDRHQWLLGWGIRVSAIVALSCIVIIVTTSRRALISIATGIALSGLAIVVAPWFPVMGIILAFPGWFAALFTFGVHSGGGYEVIAYALIINASVYGGVAFLLLRMRTSR